MFVFSRTNYLGIISTLARSRYVNMMINNIFQQKNSIFYYFLVKLTHHFIIVQVLPHIVILPSSTTNQQYTISLKEWHQIPPNLLTTPYLQSSSLQLVKWKLQIIRRKMWNMLGGRLRKLFLMALE